MQYKSGLSQIKAYADGGPAQSEIRATPVRSEALRFLAEKLDQADQFNRKPFGYNNAPGAFISTAMGVPGIQKTLERLAYGDDLTSGRGMTTRMLPETEVATLAGLQMLASPAMRMTKTGIELARRGLESGMDVFADPETIARKVAANRLAARRVPKLPSGSIYSDAGDLTNAPSMQDAIKIADDNPVDYFAAAPENIKRDSTKGFADGGYVEYDPYHVDYLTEQALSNFAAGGYVSG
tara:strand:+ start:100 stop:813 length:714 start_codon:yes stop_codon:yes gene_type:complete